MKPVAGGNGHKPGCACLFCVGRRSRSAAERFWPKVDKSGDCWLWTGATYPSGYGEFMFDTSIVAAHRAAWRLTRGSIPEGTLVLHRCDVRACVNPAHLFLGSQLDNMRDMAHKGRGVRPPNPWLTICKNGHVRTPENTKVSARGETLCRICLAASIARATAARRARVAVPQRANVSAAREAGARGERMRA